MLFRSGLRMSLDKQEGGEIAQSLDALYIYMTNRLIKANIDNTSAPIQEVIRLLTELRGAWEAISKTEVANIRKVPNLPANNNNSIYLEKV